MRNQFIYFLSFIYVSISIVSCSSKDAKVDNPAFTEHISAYTSGIIANNSRIQIRFTEPQDSIWPNEEISTDIFEFEPKIEGTAYWIDPYNLEFKPASLLPSDTKFKGYLYYDKLRNNIPDSISTFAFEFQTIKQALHLNFKGMEAYDDDQLEWQKVKLSVHTSDFTTAEDIEKTILITQNNKELKFSWEHLYDNQHIIMVDSVSRQEERGKITIHVDGKQIGAEQNNEVEIEIPSLSDFEVISSEVIQSPNQSVVLYFSDPIKKRQDLEGLVRIESGEDIRLEIDRSKITIYPKETLRGTKTILASKVINTGGYLMSKDFLINIEFTSLKPQIEFIGDGNIVPNSDGMKIPFKSVNLSGVNVKIIKIYENNIVQFFQENNYDGTSALKRVGRIVYKKDMPLVSDKAIDYNSWNTFYLDLTKFIEPEPGAIYRVNLSFDKSQSMYSCGDSTSTLTENTNTQESIEELNEKEHYNAPREGYYDDYYDYYYYDNDLEYSERDNPCNKAYYHYGNKTSITKNVFASNIGIIAKGGNTDKVHVALTQLSTTNPISGADVEVYNYQNQLIASGKTDGEGMAIIPVNKQVPFFLVAKSGNEKGYLKMNEASALSVSMYDVSGQKNNKGIKGFLYGERGVWRPGDTLFVGFILEDQQNQLPNNHPVVFELFDPNSKMFLKKVKTSSVNGFYAFHYPTDMESPTGNWLAKVSVGNNSFTKTLKVESIKPNRLKIKTDFGTDVLKNSSGPINIKASWLHGAKAKYLKTDVELSLSPYKTSFKKYKGYHFDDPAKEFEAEDQLIFEGSTDAEGIASYSHDIHVGNSAPGMLKASFKTRVFEKGGDFSIDRVIVPYSPYKSYVGVKVPKGKGWNDALYAEDKNVIPIVTVDENGKAVSRKKVKIEVFQVRWRWWWERSSNDNLARYIANSSNALIKTDYVDTYNGKAMYELSFEGSNLWGRKLIRVTDPESGHTAGQIFYLSHKGYWSIPGNESEAAEMLSFTTDKEKYKTGEEIQVNIPSFKKGRALVSVESGSKVIDQFWVTPQQGQKFTFKASDDMAPNVFVNISLIQPHQESNNDAPIRLYGIKKIEVLAPKTILNPVISMPNELAPEKQFNLSVSEKNGKNMTYTIAIVDEGLLDLTRFKTPNPWKHFYGIEALGIKTWDLYKYVLGRFTGEVSGLLAIGGDEFIGGGSKNKANRFKPVVKYLGPFELKKGEKRTHKVMLPNYIGSVRTMVIAGNGKAYGSTEKTTAVKKPLMVLATAPRVVSPDEIIELPVTVFAMNNKIKQVNVQLKTNSYFEIISKNTKSINFKEEGDKLVNFTLKAKKKIGVAKLQVLASGAGEKSSHEIELNVRTPNPKVSTATLKVLAPGETWQTNIKSLGMKGTNNNVLEYSLIPSIKLSERLNYLMQYPHGCVEQTTSSVFPQLFLDDLLKLSAKDQNEIESNIKAGIKRLQLFQNFDGGLSYWPGGSGSNHWGTNYAGHFLLEAKAKGYSIPDNLLNSWISFQKNEANRWHNTDRLYDQLTQAYRLYLLALAKKPATGAMNRLKLLDQLHPTAAWRLASAYQLIGKEKVAKEIVKDLPRKLKAYRELSNSYGSDVRDRAILLEVQTILNLKDASEKSFTFLSQKLASDNWYSTQETSYCLLSIAKYLGNEQASKTLSVSGTVNGKSVKINEKIKIKKSTLKDQTNNSIKITNNSNAKLFVSLYLQGIPLAGDVSSKNQELNMKITYKDLEGNPIDVTSLAQGSDFLAAVTIFNPGNRGYYSEMALTQIFPSGWEIRNTNMDLSTSSLIMDRATYSDTRDDRVLRYFNIGAGKSKTFVTLLNASYLGEYYLPTVYCEAMYDNTINARVGGKKVKVVKAE